MTTDVDLIFIPFFRLQLQNAHMDIKQLTILFIHTFCINIFYAHITLCYTGKNINTMTCDYGFCESLTKVMPIFFYFISDTQNFHKNEKLNQKIG